MENQIKANIKNLILCQAVLDLSDEQVAEFSNKELREITKTLLKLYRNNYIQLPDEPRLEAFIDGDKTNFKQIDKSSKKFLCPIIVKLNKRAIISDIIKSEYVDSNNTLTALIYKRKKAEADTAIERIRKKYQNNTVI